MQKVDKLNEANWTVIITHEQEGAYSYRTGVALLRHNHRRGTYAISRWGFRWRGNSGGAYQDYYHCPADLADQMRQTIEAIIQNNGELANMDMDLLFT